MGGATTAASGSGGDDTGQMLLENLVPALAQTFALVLLGVLTARFSLLPPHAGETLGAYTAKFALPALIFTAMSTLNLGDASMGLLAGMCGAKLALAVVVALVSLALSRGGSRERGWSMAAIFAMLTTMQNDFALGLPILNALYTDEDPASLRKSDYLYLFAPISVMIINPLCFAVLELANAIARNSGDGDAADAQPIGCWFLCRQVVIPTLGNPVVFSVGLGIVANLVQEELPVPAALSGALDTLGASFSSLALFVLGLSMSSGADSAAEGQDDQPRGRQVTSARLSMADIRSAAGLDRDRARKDIGTRRWVQALLLVGAKSVLLPILARSAVLLTTKGNDELSRFAFIYATFPAAPSVYLFAVRFKLQPGDLAHISLTTLLGTILAAPIMFVTAQMIMIDVACLSDAERFADVLDAADAVGLGSLVFSSWTLLCCTSMLLSRAESGRAWRRQHIVWAVWWYLLTQAGCVAANLLDAPTLVTEVAAFATRLWGVILLVAEIHLTHRNAASDAGGVWVLLRAGKYGVLWCAWLLPSGWAVLLWATKLDEGSSAGAAPSSATEDYRLASAGACAALALVAIGCLVWAQRQDDPGVDTAAVDPAAVAAESDATARLLNSAERPVSVWPSLRLRIVGLANLVGLLAQVAVGVGSLLPASMDGSSLEIMALSNFALFVQGCCTGLMLGGWSGSPLVASLERLALRASDWWTANLVAIDVSRVTAWSPR